MLFFTAKKILRDAGRTVYEYALSTLNTFYWFLHQPFLL